MRFSVLFTLALIGLNWFVGEAQAWPPRGRAATAYTSGYLAPYYPPGPTYTAYYDPYSAIIYLNPPALPSGIYPSAFPVYDAPLTTTNIPRYFHGLPPPTSNEYSSDRWRR